MKRVVSLGLVLLPHVIPTQAALSNFRFNAVVGAFNILPCSYILFYKVLLKIKRAHLWGAPAFNKTDNLFFDQFQYLARRASGDHLHEVDAGGKTGQVNLHLRMVLQRYFDLLEQLATLVV